MTARLRQFAATPITHRKAVVILMITAALWSTSGLFIKLLALSPIAIWGGRSWVVALVFFLWIRPKSFRFTLPECVAAFGYMFVQFFFIWALQHAPAANVIFLQYTSPLWVIPLAWLFLRERPRKIDWLTMAVIFVGMLFLLGDGLQFEGVKGNVLALISGVFMAIMMVAMRMQKSGRPENSLLLGSVLGGLISTPTLLETTFTGSDVLILLYLGLFQIGLGMILFSIVIKHLQALEATIITTLEPILTPVWVFLVLGEVPRLLAIVGALLVLFAVSATAFYENRT